MKILKSIIVRLKQISILVISRFSELRNKCKAKRESKIKTCQFCANWGTMDCPNSSKCFALPDKPYWKVREKPIVLNTIK